VSPRRLPKRAHIHGLPPQEGEGSAGAIRRTWLVGKQSAKPNPNRSASTSVLVKRSSSLGNFHRVSSLLSPPRQDAHSGSLVGAGQIGSAALSFPSGRGKTLQKPDLPISCLVVTIFSRSQRSMSLTGGCSGRKISPARRRSKRIALCKSPNGPVAGVSPENAES
jgi:hypothetical protein